MTDTLSKDEIVKVGSNTLKRYSNDLVREALKDIQTNIQGVIQTLIIKKKVLLVAAKQDYGVIFTEICEGENIDITVIESYNRLDDVYTELSKNYYNLIILTNTSLTPPYIRELVSEVKKRYPKIRTLVCSGYMPFSFHFGLKAIGVDSILRIPFSPNVFVNTIKELLSTTSDEKISILLSPRLFGRNFPDLSKNIGFKVMCAQSLQELESIAETNNIDLAIDWQSSEQDYMLRDMLRNLGKVVPIYLSLNWNGNAPASLQELGYVDTLKAPFKIDEIRLKIFNMLTPAKQAILNKMDI